MADQARPQTQARLGREPSEAATVHRDGGPGGVHHPRRERLGVHDRRRRRRHLPSQAQPPEAPQGQTSIPWPGQGPAGRGPGGRDPGDPGGQDPGVRDPLAGS